MSEAGGQTVAVLYRYALPSTESETGEKAGDNFKWDEVCCFISICYMNIMVPLIGT
jgi:hypothetical protein